MSQEGPHLDHENVATPLNEEAPDLWKQHSPPAVHQLQVLCVLRAQLQTFLPCHLLPAWPPD